MKKNGISFLIPTYNCLCKDLVSALHQQCMKMNIPFEIIVADDGSPEKKYIQENEEIRLLTNVKYLIQEKNVGRSAIRNYLANQAHHEWLVFMDGDMLLRNEQYVENYWKADGEVVYGGYDLGEYKTELKNNLRYVYELKNIPSHSVEQRQKDPFKDFHTSNFMVNRQLMLRIPFDERFRQYGYEDVLWGKILKEKGITIHHIDNPLTFELFEDNKTFLDKTEEGLQTLHRFKQELQGFSSLLTYYNRLGKCVIFLKYCYQMAGKNIRNYLQHNKPRLFVFYIYKLLYYSSL